jgi:hypothetical protein
MSLLIIYITKKLKKLKTLNYNFIIEKNETKKKKEEEKRWLAGHTRWKVAFEPPAMVDLGWLEGSQDDPQPRPWVGDGRAPALAFFGVVYLPLRMPRRSSPPQVACEPPQGWLGVARGHPHGLGVVAS